MALIAWAVLNMSGGKASGTEIPIPYESSTANIQKIMITPAAVSGALNNTLRLRCHSKRLSHRAHKTRFCLEQPKQTRITTHNTLIAMRTTHRYDAVSEENSAEIVKRTNGPKHTPVRYGIPSTKTMAHVGSRKPRSR
jgi:hypothetical protein